MRVLGFGLLFGAMAAWALSYVSGTTFVYRGELYVCLFDDAMISMTYAKNLLDGAGFNWARFGPPVEGYTHPLWTLLLIPLEALPLPARLRCFGVQALSFACLVANVLVVASLARVHFAVGERKSWVPAVVATAFYSPVAFWSLLGMESALQALLVSSGIHLAYDVCHRGKRRHVALFAVLGAAVLLRLDMILFAAGVVAYVAWQKGFPRAERRAVAVGIAIFLLLNLGYLAFRLAYFGELLPNTYYLKLTGYPLLDRLVRGARYLILSLGSLWVVALALFAGCLPWLRRAPRLVLVLFLPVVYSAYSVWVGGDAWEGQIVANRFVCFVMPLLFLAATWLLNAAAEKLALAPTTQRLVAFLVTLVLVVSFNDLWWSRKDEYRLHAYFGRVPPIDAPITQLRARELLALGEVLKPGARIAVTWAGIAGYFTDFELVDLMGYNDAHVARVAPPPVATKVWDRWMPGHMKSDYDYVLRELRPDAIVHFTGNPQRLFGDLGYRVFGWGWAKPYSPYLIRD